MTRSLWCPTCGEAIDPDEARCAHCGAARQPDALTPGAPVAGPSSPAAGEGRLEIDDEFPGDPVYLPLGEQIGLFLRRNVTGLALLGILLVVLVGIALGTRYLATTGVERASNNISDAGCCAGARQVSHCISLWAQDHDGEYPPPEAICKSGSVGYYTDRWPTNYYTHAPMTIGEGVGDLTYEVSEKGFDFTLSVRLSGDRIEPIH